jgi:uncharacterized protein (DUF488 family)
MKPKQIDSKSQPVIWSVGHSNRPIQSLLDLLHGAGIETVIDCRSKPRSRWPQFNGAQLALHLAAKQIRYEPRGTNIGGFGINTGFDKTLDELADRAKHDEHLALLCSEGKPQDCHRGTILTPELVKRGITVEHLLYDGQKNIEPSQARLSI